LKEDAMRIKEAATGSRKVPFVMTITSARPTISPTKRPRAARWAQQALGWLFLLGSISHVVFGVGVTEIYRDFAAWSPFEWVRDAWASVFMPNALAFALLLAAFEATVGALILAGGRKMQLGLVGAIGFHIGLMLFGLWPWSVPMIAAFLALLVSDRRRGGDPDDYIRGPG
jgi:hypothetical protein